MKPGLESYGLTPGPRPAATTTMVKSPRKKMKDADSPLRTPTRPAGIEDDEMTPIKTPSRRSPRKASTPKTSTPTRTKAWGSPRKLFDLESQMNDSWADMMNAEGEDYPAPSMTQSEPRRRKGAVPKKAGTRPKFVKSIELTDALLSPKPRQAERPQPPVSASNNRKRHLSTASSMAEAEELGASPTKRANTGTPNRVPAKKKHLFAADQASPRSPQIKVKDNWAEPKAGWCTDVLVLERRTKELEKAKDKSVYKRYAEEVPKTDRVKGMHPKTPNKLLNYSRRSWDVQVRRWKRELYVWAGEEPTDSANSSFCCSESETESVLGDPEEAKENHVSLSLTEIVVGRPEADQMASLLGKFEMDTNGGSTLKGPAALDCQGPTDFSAF